MQRSARGLLPNGPLYSINHQSFLIARPKFAKKSNWRL